MADQPAGECSVCGEPTAQRCSGCGKAGIDVFFCCRDHQKLVWPAHRRVCGKSPFQFPPLTPFEVEQADYWQRRKGIVVNLSLGIFLHNWLPGKVDYKNPFLPISFFQELGEGGKSPHSPTNTAAMLCTIRTYLRDALYAANDPDSPDVDPECGLHRYLLNPLGTCSTFVSHLNAVIEDGRNNAVYPVDEPWFVLLMHHLIIYGAVCEAPFEAKQANYLATPNQKWDWNLAFYRRIEAVVREVGRKDRALGRGLEEAYNHILAKVAQGRYLDVMKEF
ncbi:hypothetical protein JCM10207_005709 [Rhodosporidiobolus poonsookiae]